MVRQISDWLEWLGWGNVKTHLDHNSSLNVTREDYLKAKRALIQATNWTWILWARLEDQKDETCCLEEERADRKTLVHTAHHRIHHSAQGLTSHCFVHRWHLSTDERSGLGEGISAPITLMSGRRDVEARRCAVNVTLLILMETGGRTECRRLDAGFIMEPNNQCLPEQPELRVFTWLPHVGHCQSIQLYIPVFLIPIIFFI